MYLVALYFMLAVGAFFAGRWLPSKPSRTLGFIAALVALAPAVTLFRGDSPDALGWCIAVAVLSAGVGHGTRPDWAQATH